MFKTIKELQRLKDIALILAKNGFDDLVTQMGLEKYM